MTLYQRLVAAGFGDSIDHHESDLYVPVTNKSSAILEEWLRDTGLRSSFFETFTDQTTGDLMYDIPFQYDPYWAT